MRSVHCCTTCQHFTIRLRWYASCKLGCVNPTCLSRPAVVHLEYRCTKQQRQLHSRRLLSLVFRATIGFALCLPALLLDRVQAIAAQPSRPEPAAYGGHTAAEWIERLESPDIQARWYAAYALGQLGSDAREAVEPLMRILEDQREYEYVRGSAAWALGRIGLPEAKPAVPLLIETLSSRHVSVRRYACWALARLAPAADEAVPRLRRLLADEDAQVRIRAAAALWAIAEQPEAVALLRETIRRGGPDGCVAAELLGRMPAGEAVTSLLVEALNMPDEELRQTAAWALAQQGPRVLDALEAPLAAEQPATRRAAVEALGLLGSAGMERLIRTLEDPSAEVRAAAARELGRLGPEASQAEPALVKVLGDSEAAVREAAAWALKQLRTGRE